MLLAPARPRLLLAGPRLLDDNDEINLDLDGFWPLDEPGGNIVRDISPYRRHAVATTSTPARFLGRRGRAAKFTSYGYFGVPSFEWPASSAITVSFWAAPLVGDNGGFSIGSAEEAGCWLNYGTATYWDYPRAPARMSTTRLYSSQWALVTLVADTLGFRGIYFNGVLAASITGGGSGPGALTGLYIGAYPAGGGRIANGFNNFRIWRRRLLVPEIERLYWEPWAGTTIAAERLFYAAPATSGVVGSGAAILGALTGAAAGSVGITAAAAATLGALTGAATATVGITATASATLAALGGASGAVNPITGTQGGALAALTGAASASVGITAGAAATLAALSGSASAAVAISAQGAASLAALTGQATATVSDPLDVEPAPASRTVTAFLLSREVVARYEDRTVTAPYVNRTITARE